MQRLQTLKQNNKRMLLKIFKPLNLKTYMRQTHSQENLTYSRNRNPEESYNYERH